MLANDKQFVIETLNSNHPEFEEGERKKRELFGDETVDQNGLMVLIYETPASGGSCALKTSNLKKMKADPVEAVSLNTFGESEAEGKTEYKRAVQEEDEREVKAIELAVFVDDNLYRAKKSPFGYEESIQNIQNFVYAYLGSVQLLYQSERLDVKFYIELLELDIMTRPERSIDKHGGDIEEYLDSFCKWQEIQNVESDNPRSDHPDRWDHALLLTGMDLYDTSEEYNSVIGIKCKQNHVANEFVYIFFVPGLAWVSGMCHPTYSCTINEGNNFESVYVIAHEMGHK